MLTHRWAVLRSAIPMNITIQKTVALVTMALAKLHKQLLNQCRQRNFRSYIHCKRLVDYWALWCCTVGWTRWFQPRCHSSAMTGWWKPFWWRWGLRWLIQHAATVQLQQRDGWHSTTSWSITLLYFVYWFHATNTVTTSLITIITIVAVVCSL